MVNGIINIYKEAGFTSHDVVAKLRGIVKQRKIGHTGTLDPDATGVLPVCFGNATKLCDMLTDKSKEYEACLILGVTTDTQDMSGEILTRQTVTCSEEDAKQAVLSFIGGYEQIPPMYSAIKVNGKKLYELARNGIEIERKPRRVEIPNIKIVECNLPEIRFVVSCSKGTYIRQLGQDIAHKLNTCGHLISLRRTRIGNFDVGQASKVKEVKEEDLISVTKALSHMVVVRVEQSLETDIKNGKKVKLSVNEEIVFVINENEDPIAILEKVEENIYRVKRGLF